MKKFFIITLSIIGFILLALFTLPFLFKDKIKAAIDKQISENVDAKVYYDTDRLGISFFKNFPSLTVTLKNFGVIGNGVFAKDTLISVGEFGVAVNVMSVISGDAITINKISLITPNIHVIKLKNGKANYDIAKAKPTPETPEPSKEPSKFNIKIKKWEIVDGNIAYNDHQQSLAAYIIRLNHTGAGDFSQDLVDLATETSIAQLSVSKDTVSYLSKNKFFAKLNLAMDMPHSKYTFKDNLIKINDFGFGFNGWVQTLKDSSIAMDLSYGVKESTFKSLLSLVPGIYTKSFDDLRAEGTLAFDGFAKGVYSKQKLPSFGLNLLVKNGNFQYTKLPTPVKNVQVDLKISNPDGIVDNTLVNLQKLHLDIGSNPVDARLLLKGLKKYDIDAALNATLNLGELTSVFPIDSLTLKGLFTLNAKAKGVYTDPKHLPTLDINMGMKNGYVKSEKLPGAPMENINFTSNLSNATGLLQDMRFDLVSFTMLFLKEPFFAKASVTNFEDYTYNANMKGKVDIGSVMKIFPMEGMKIAGLVDADITTAGKMSLINARKYDQLTTQGTIGFRNFYFANASLPQGFKMTEGLMSFDPQEILVTKMNGFIGKSNFNASGIFSNYMAYVFSGNTLKGQVNFNSTNFDLNEWMSTTSGSNTAKADTKADSAMPAAIPKNIDFEMAAKLGKVTFQKYEMTNMAGIIKLKDGVFRLEQGFFNMLDGEFRTTMAYDTKDTTKPGFEFAMDIKQLDFKKAYENFNSIQKLSPVAKNIDGKFNANFSTNGKLGKGYSPIYPTLFGNGTLFIQDARLKDMSFLNQINSVAKLTSKNLEEIRLQNTTIKFSIKQGRVFFEPFDINSGETKSTISGSQGIDKSIDYNIKSIVPAGAAGNAAAGLLSKVTGKQITGLDKLAVDMKVTGYSNSPNVKIISIAPYNNGQSGSAGTSVKDQLKDTAKAQADKMRAEAEQKAREEAQRLQQQALDRAAEEARKRLDAQNAEKIRQEAEKLKQKVKLPF